MNTELASLCVFYLTLFLTLILKLKSHNQNFKTMLDLTKNFSVLEADFDLVIDALQHSDRKVTFELVCPQINVKTGEIYDTVDPSIKSYYCFTVCPMTDSELDNLNKMVAIAHQYEIDAK